MSPGRGDGPHRPIEIYCPEPRKNRSDDRDGRPYHDFGLPVLGVRFKRRSRCSTANPGRAMVPIARLRFYCPEPRKNRSDDRDGRPYHDFVLPVSGVRSKRRSRCSTVNPGRGDGPHRLIEIYCPEPETNRSDDRDGRPYHDFGLPVLGIRSYRRSRMRRVEVCFNL